MNRSLILLLSLLCILTSAYGMDQEVFFVYSHGIAADGLQAEDFLRNTRDPRRHWIIPGKCSSFNYHSVTYQSTFRLNREGVYLAQQPDIDRLAEHVKDGKAPTVIVGLSCGASTALNFASQCNPDNLRALVLESPFDDPMSIVDHILARNRLASLPCARAFGAALLSLCFPNYDLDGITPLQQITEHPIRTPTFMVASLEDKLVPAWSTIRLYQAMIEANPHVYLLLLNKGKHSKLLHQEEGSIYQAAVNAFYKEHNLPYDEKLAERGKIILADCQPTHQELAQYLPET